MFERTELERQTFDISGLDNRLALKLISTTVLKNETGKRKTGELTTLQYLFDFLDAYDFTSEGSEEIQEQNKNLINASVLGLIFEKINGYKDGSFFTPGFVTMYMCRETIRRSVVQKFNEKYKIDCESFDDLKNFVSGRFKAKDILEFNTVINELKICDPAVGSGHFLVSALNEVIAIKAELGILADKDGIRLTGYEVKIENDELIITYNDNTEIFEYSVTGNSIAKETQRVQKTLFHEKESIIENSLFGVDINPNSVKICRLRLWIELLKNAYYTEESKCQELETLPNIDINIKCGNSLISRFPLDSDLKKALKGKWNIDTYKIAVHSYHEAENKEEKRKLEELIDTIKKDFRTEIGSNDPRRKKLTKLKEELFLLTVSPKLELDVEMKKGGVKLEKEKVKKLTDEITKIEQELKDIENNKIFENAFEWRFEFPEVLDKEGKFIGFDVVIGNPPYGSLLEADQKKYCKENYPHSFGGNFDVFIFFIERAFKILNENKYLTYITPDSWLNIPQSKNLRKLTLETADISTIVAFSFNVFEEANVNAVIFSTEPKSKERKAKILFCNNSDINSSSTEVSEISVSKWREDENSSINIHQTELINDLVSKVKKGSIPAIDLLDVSQGIIPYSKEHHGAENVKKRFFHSKSKLSDEYGMWVQGRVISRYSIDTTIHEYLKYGAFLHRPRKAKYFQGKRILIQEITGGNPPSISSSIYEGRLYHDPGIITCLGITEIPLEYILGIINSKLISWYHRVNSPKGKRNQFPKILIEDVRHLPIKIATSEKQKQLFDLVKKTLELKSSEKEKEFLSIDKEIDKLVYNIYGLNQEEIKIIEKG